MAPVLLVAVPVLVAAGAVVATLTISMMWSALALPLVAIAGLAVWDAAQIRHSVLRNYPLAGHLRYVLEMIRPEIQQYFIERSYDGRPFDRDTRRVIYDRAKGGDGTQPFGTHLEIHTPGHEFVLHSVAALPPAPHPPRVRVGGPACTKPYEMALLNVSGMSFGALSGNAILALSSGAALGGFAHDTGEGGISEHHLAGGADLIWELGTGYFGARTDEGAFDPDQFADTAAHPAVKCVELKLSQGAKPGSGGVLPGRKVTAAIAAARGVPAGQTCVSPPGHGVFDTPRELVRFLARLRELAEGKPVGIKLCPGSRREFLAICKAMLTEDTTPDFVVVDGAEGGTGAAPAEYIDHIGLPLTQGLMLVHNALVGTGLRERIAVGASGKVATGLDLVTRLAQGADYTNSARAMMMAIGCIQATRCHTNTCPTGVATQNRRRARALHVPDKTARVAAYQRATVAEAQKIIGAMGLTGPEGLSPEMLMHQVDPHEARSYAELYRWLDPGALLEDPPPDWAQDWSRADPDRFAVA